MKLITQQIAAAKPGDIISIDPGYYPEALVLDKPLTLISSRPESSSAAGGMPIISPPQGTALTVKGVTVACVGIYFQAYGSTDTDPSPVVVATGVKLSAVSNAFGLPSLLMTNCVIEGNYGATTNSLLVDSMDVVLLNHCQVYGGQTAVRARNTIETGAGLNILDTDLAYYAGGPYAGLGPDIIIEPRGTGINAYLTLRVEGCRFQDANKALYIHAMKGSALDGAFVTGNHYLSNNTTARTLFEDPIVVLNAGNQP